MVISDNLYQFGVAIEAACREWEVTKGREPNISNWEFRDFLSHYLSERGVMIRAIKQEDIDQLGAYELMWVVSPPVDRFQAAFSATFGCSQFGT